MRLATYTIVEKNTKTKVENVGVNYKKADARVKELEANNPNGDYAIITKWGNL